MMVGNRKEPGVIPGYRNWGGRIRKQADPEL